MLSAHYDAADIFIYQYYEELVICNYVSTGKSRTDYPILKTFTNTKLNNIDAG